MQNLFLTLCFFTALNLAAKDDPKFPVSDIPEELKENVNAVIREDKMIFSILSKSRATLYVYEAITILNSNGKSFAYETVGYDKLSRITTFKGSVYNADGVLIKKLKSNEIYDQSAFDGLYGDNRSKTADLSQGVYPYTVEYEYEIEFKSLFHIPGFVVLPDEKVSVQHSEYKLIYPTALKPRYQTVNVEAQPVITDLGSGTASMAWTFKNIKPIKLEPMGPAEQEVVPHIFPAPTAFEYDGYSGIMETWDQFGQWIVNLNKGRNVLPEATQQKIKAMTSALKTPEEKVKAIYEYMQNKTRYVSIQLGIGGYQPFEAAVVDQVGYGDCKALSNYMVSMLDIIGIKSHYVLIRAGEGAAPINTQFPSSQFNHAVVCVPNGADTLWLECTSQTNPFGYMGGFTGNRKALAITENGARIVRTPVYTAEHNVQSRTAKVMVTATGDATATVKTTYAGLQYENDNLNFVLNNQYDDQKKWLRKNINIPSFDIKTFKMINSKQRIPSANIDVELTLNRFATVSGKRIFLTPNLMNRFSFIPEKLENRKTSVVRKMAYTDFDTIHYQLPEGLYPEFLPNPVKLQSRFGEYEASFKLEQNELIYIRKIKMLNGQFPPESYNELIDFYKGINKADNIKMVFLNKT